MKFSILLFFVSICVLPCLLGFECKAQFSSTPFSQQYNSDTTSTGDSADVMFSFKEYFGALKHKNSMKIGTMFAGSMVFVGGSQIYNKDYWKLPLVYGTIGAGIAGGIYFNSQGNSSAASWCFAGAGFAYWATLMDGVLSYRPSVYPHAGRATLLSILVPGLGQFYNKEYWKIPIYLGGMGFSLYYYFDCAKNFRRFRNIYLQATDYADTYDGPITASQALYYRDIYRRYRDYSVLALAVVYLLQIIDANVFSYMHDFEVTDDLSMDMSPTIIMPDSNLAFSNSSWQSPALGLKLGFRF